MRSDRGSVLMLVPAAVLVLVVLGAIAVDASVVFAAQRDLANRVAAASNDVAGSATDEAAFYDGGRVAIDDRRAQRVVATAFAPAVRPRGFDRWSAHVRTLSDRTVEVTATAEVRYVFAAALPGVHHTAIVHARSVATARGG